jgi:hypothetical protein
MPLKKEVQRPSERSGVSNTKSDLHWQYIAVFPYTHIIIYGNMGL